MLELKHKKSTHHDKANQQKTWVSTLISDTLDIRIKNMRKDKESNFRTIKFDYLRGLL